VISTIPSTFTLSIRVSRRAQTREIKESGIIGGNTKKVYAIGPTETIVGAKPYANKGGSPWGTLNHFSSFFYKL